MCFSATASFAAAAVIGATGLATMTQAKSRSDLPLASVPLVFAAQQAIEGMLWLTVPAGHAAGRGWASAFALIALAVWPLLTPLAVGLVELSRRRRRVILALLLPGAVAALYATLTIITHPYQAWPDRHALTYINNDPYPPGLAALYLVAVAAPPLASTNPWLKGFGLVILLGRMIAFAAFFVDFVSVWCFFAALASLVLLGFFKFRAPVPA